MHQDRVKKISNGLINLFLMPLIVIALLGSLSLIVPAFQGMSSLAIKLVTGLCFIGLVIAISQPLRQVCRKLITGLYAKGYPHRRVLMWVVIVLTLCWQLAIIYLLSGQNAYDTGKIMDAAINGAQAHQTYFSLNQNTLLLLFIERGFWLMTGQPSLTTFVIYANVINLILIDGGFLMLAYSVNRLFGKQYQSALFVIGELLFLLSPWVAVPYTDTWAFFLTAAIVAISVSYVNNHKTWCKYVLAVMMGLTVTMAYLIKPSIVIALAAFCIIGIFRFFNNHERHLRSVVLISMLLVVIGFGASFTAYKSFIEQQSFVTIDKKMGHPMIHFIAIGMHGTGAYNYPDAELDVSIKSPKKRQQANAKLIKERIQGFNGWTNYQRFITKKQVNNIADGTFSWGADVQIDTNQANSHARNQTIIRRLFAKQGHTRENTYEYQFVAQLIWSVCLALIVFTISSETWRVQVFKYGVVGFMLFLLIFEGGRSRYVVQFLPLMMVLSTVGAVNLMTKLRARQALKRD
mgnify:CR=1 FL=1